MDDLEDAGEAVGYSATNATESIKRRRAEMKNWKLPIKNIWLSNAKLTHSPKQSMLQLKNCGSKRNLNIEKKWHENNMQDLREKKQQGKAKWLIEKAENLLEEFKDDYKYSQGSQKNIWI